jgi:hypothetical protein
MFLIRPVSRETGLVQSLPNVMAGLVPAIHAALVSELSRIAMPYGVDGRDKSGHDGEVAL